MDIPYNSNLPKSDVIRAISVYVSLYVYIGKVLVMTQFLKLFSPFFLKKGLLVIGLGS